MNITDEMVEAAARVLASIEPGEDWPSNEDLGGNLTGTRDDEYRDGMRDMARAALEAALAEGDTEWEHSIAYRYGGEWEGADDLFADEQSARISLRDGGYRWNDQVVRRRKAGPWEPVEDAS